MDEKFYCMYCGELVPFKNPLSRTEMVKHLDQYHSDSNAALVEFDPHDPCKCFILNAIRAYS